jgi:hypothetical protein
MDDVVISVAALKSALRDEIERIPECRYPELLRLTRLHRQRKPKPSTGPLVLPAPAPQTTTTN